MFEKIFGNDEVKKILYNDINNKKIVSSYIFEGKDSDYLESLAMEFAGLLLNSKIPDKKADFALFGKGEKNQERGCSVHSKRRLYKTF